MVGGNIKLSDWQKLQVELSFKFRKNGQCVKCCKYLDNKLYCINKDCYHYGYYNGELI